MAGNKLDPQLTFLVEGGAGELAQAENAESLFTRFGLEPATAPKSRRGQRNDQTPAADVRVLVRYTGDPDELTSTGLHISTIAGDVITGSIPLASVGALAEHATVEQVEAARSMHPELDLSVVEARIDQVHTGPPGRRGAGVIVGICDSGCDFTHPSFIRPDGTSRILLLWDQGLIPNAAERNPTGFNYGVEYTNADINTALAATNPFATVRHRDRGGHGTHVTGIAAGDGSAAGQGRPGGTFVGVAPDADIIVVANRGNGAEGLGTSASTLDAVNYIFQQAAHLTRPCAVNMSLGDNLGPHDGTSLLERGLDNLLGTPGRAFVKSAGNAGADRIHAQGTVAAGTTVDVGFNQPAGDTDANQIDLWYSGNDTFRISVIDPAGNTAGPTNVGNTTSVTFPGGNMVRIDHRDRDPNNNDRRVFMTFTPGAATSMASGNWTIRIQGVVATAGGAFDAWIQRGRVVPTFLAPHENNARTISTPGTAREVITAANYTTRGAGVGSLQASSSRGPTRDLRPAPTVAAPGMLIMSADGESSSGDPYRLDGGTSMAAPHVTGTIALMFQKNGDLTQGQIKTLLESTARTDTQTGPVPNTAWGAGKMDANAAVTQAPAPVLSVPAPACTVVSVPRLTCNIQSVIAKCPSIPLSGCNLVSVPRFACIQPSVALDCQSVVARCQSFVPGCNPASVVDGCRSLAVDCQSLACDPQSLACNPRSLACGFQSIACRLPGGPGRFEAVNPPAEAVNPAEAAPEDVPATWLQLPNQVPAPPAQGYYDYDERWFD